MTLERSIPLALTVVCAVALFGVGRSELRSRKMTAAAKPNAGQDGAPELNLAGTIGPTIAVPVAARNFHLIVPLNSAVRMGDVIGTEEPAGGSAELEQARRELEDAKSAERQAVEAVRRVEEQLAAAESRVSSMDRGELEADVTESDAAREFDRDQLLYHSGLASRFDYDAAVLARASAGTAVDSVRANLSEAAIDIDEMEAAAVDAKTELREATARRGAAQAAFYKQRDESSVRLVAAPADGVIVASTQAEGPSVGIASNCGLFAHAMVAEADLMRVRIGQQAAIVIDGQPSGSFSAQVIAIAETPVDSPDGSFYEVSFAVKNPGGPWLSGVAMHAHFVRPAP